MNTAGNKNTLVKVLPTRPAHGTTVSYQATDILEWVGSLAVAAENAEYQQGVYHPTPIGGSELPLGVAVPIPLKPYKSYLAPSSVTGAECSDYWSFESIIAPRDPTGWKTHGPSLNQLCAEVCERYEEDPEIFESYQKVRARLELSLDRILYMPNSALLTRTLYADVLESLQTVLSRRKSETPPCTKQDANTVLTEWLRENWINPFPDETCLEELSRRCGGKPVDQINTWVGNARARKWRPALMQAKDLGRPADYLLEDSLAIFDGRPIDGVAYKRGRDS